MPCTYCPVKKECYAKDGPVGTVEIDLFSVSNTGSVQILNVKKTLCLRRTIRNTVLMSVAVLQLIEESWKSITKRRQLEMVLQGPALNVNLN